VDISITMCRIASQYTHDPIMRTNIDIDNDLLSEAMAATGMATKKATVEEALRAIVARHRRMAALEDMAGLGWDGDLDAMRNDGTTAPSL
jgi:Arc/MetJ family transcription regulator